MDYNIHPIKIIRILKNLTQEEMAGYFSVTKSYISAIEKEKNAMDISRLKLGLEKLDITIDDYIQLCSLYEQLKHHPITEPDKYKIMITRSAAIISYPQMNAPKHK